MPKIIKIEFGLTKLLQKNGTIFDSHSSSEYCDKKLSIPALGLSPCVHSVISLLSARVLISMS